MEFVPGKFHSSVCRADLKYRARMALSGRWGVVILAVVVFALVTIACNMVPIVGPILLMPPLTLGLDIFFLRFYRYGENQIENMFKGFDMFGKAMGVYWLTQLYVFLWSLLFIVPGIIASYNYSQAMLILYENPEISVTEALRRSKAMMYGNKMTLFVQDLSFLGWFLLSIFPGFYIGFLWSQPYNHVTRIAFYDNLLESAGMLY
ncbi:MAG: DUF975 family protein [Ruminiclostridium sp.]|nr:DUF975 family protein [Ruminiclostridium sp.]